MLIQEIWELNLQMGNQSIIGHEQGNSRPCLVIITLLMNVIRTATAVVLESLVSSSAATLNPQMTSDDTKNAATSKVRYLICLPSSA